MVPRFRVIDRFTFRQEGYQQREPAADRLSDFGGLTSHEECLAAKFRAVRPKVHERAVIALRGLSSRVWKEYP